MPAKLYLPATPSLRRIAFAFVSLHPFRFGEWYTLKTCGACGGNARGYRNAAGEFDLTTCHNHVARPGFAWWYCEACGGSGSNVTDAVPLHVAAGLAVARLRVAEINPDAAAGLTDAADVRAWLLANDPELVGADG